MEVQSDVRVTRGQVDNENNNQSQDSNILNNIHGRSLIDRVRGHSISWGYWKCEWDHSKEMSTGMGKHRNAELDRNKRQELYYRQRY